MYIELLTSDIRRTKRRSAIGKAFSQLHFHSPTFGFEGIEELGASPGLLLSVLKPNARSIPDAGHGQSCGSLEPGVGGKRKSYGLWRL